MTDQDYIYGVFSDASNVTTVVSQLHDAGLHTSEICVLGNKSEQFTNVAGKIEDPNQKYFIKFGIGGAIAGLIAGLAMSMHIPGINGFQLIVPLMGAISGGACFPYCIIQMGMFLTSNKPQHWANVFEGAVEGGSVIVMAEPQSSAQREAAMAILLAYNPSELLFRRKPWGVVPAAAPPPAIAASVSASYLEGEFEAERERRLTAVA